MLQVFFSQSLRNVVKGDGILQLSHYYTRQRFSPQRYLGRNNYRPPLLCPSRVGKTIRIALIREVGIASKQCWQSMLRNPVLTGFGGAILLTLGATNCLSQGYSWRVHCQSHESQVNANSEAKHEPEQRFDWKRFWMYLKPFIWEFLGAVAATLIVAFINIQIPNLLGNLINILARYANTYVKDPLTNHFFRDISKPASGLLTLYVLHSIFTFGYIYLLCRVSERLAANIRQDLFKQFLLQDMEFFDRHRTADLMNQLTADVHDFKVSFRSFVSQGLRNVAQLIGGSISLLWLSPHMAAIALASVPAVVILMTYLGKALRRISRLSQNQQDRATAMGAEAIANIRTVRASGGESREIQQFGKEIDEGTRLAEELGYGFAIFQGLTNFFLNSLVLSTLFIGGHLMSTESLTPGSLMAFLVAAQGIQRSLAQTSVLLGTMIRGLTAGTRIFENLQIQPQVNLYEGYEIPTEGLHGEIKFENVGFAYPTRPNYTVLKDFNLTVRPGETVALVGPSGSGKSTVAALLERFYEPTSGSIKLDGYKLVYLSPQWLRAKILGFIEQQPVLFATSIYNNICYGCPEAEEQDVQRAAKLSQADDFIMELPEGYKTHVGERGLQLSGGQRQRIAIARALLKNPRVLILDEATSALDAASELEVQKSLDSATVDRTTLVIAHRLSTIRNADFIVVLDRGRIVESGKHDDLMLRRGLYYTLVCQQEKQQKQEDASTGNSLKEDNSNANESQLPSRPYTAQG